MPRHCAKAEWPPRPTLAVGASKSLRSSAESAAPQPRRSGRPLQNSRSLALMIYGHLLTHRSGTREIQP